MPINQNACAVVRKLLAQAQEWAGKKRGRQTEIAKALGVKRQSVSLWFSEYLKEKPDYSPTAGQALELAAFLKSQARKEAKAGVICRSPTSYFGIFEVKTC